MRLKLFLAGALAATSAASVAFAAPVSSVSVSVSPAVQSEAAKRTGRFGQRDIDFLSQTLQRQIERRAGVSAEGDRIEVTISDLKPNRPTFKEMSAKPGLWAMSPSIGGAKLEGVRIAADGRRTPINFKTYDIDIRQSLMFGLTPWSTAQNAFQGFARKVAQS